MTICYKTEFFIIGGFVIKIKKSLTIAVALCTLLSMLSVSFVTADAEEKQTSGGWTVSDISANNLTAKENDILEQAMMDYTGINYEAKDIIAHEVVAGDKYAYLCFVSSTVPNSEGHWSIFNVLKKWNSDAILENISDIKIDNVATQEKVTPNAPGGYYSYGHETAAPVPDNVQKALEESEDVSLSAIAVLGTQDVSGTNYRILTYGESLVINEESGYWISETEKEYPDPELETHLYVADVYSAPDGHAEITSLKPFAIGPYLHGYKPNTVVTNTDTDTENDSTSTDSNSTDSASDIESKSTIDTDTSANSSIKNSTDTSANSSNTGSVTSPKTGYSSYSILIFLIVVMAAASVAVSSLIIYKKST